MIRQARLEDKDYIRDLILEFCKESLNEFKLSFDLDTLNETIENFIRNFILLVVEKDKKIVGIIAGLVSNSIFDRNQKIAQEAMWYMTKNERRGTAGVRLLKEFENECKKRGANVISMIRMSNLDNGLDHLYRKRNYKLTESHYLKEV